MATLYSIVVVIHLLGWAIVLGGTITSMRKPRIAPGVLHGALTALVTGIILVGLAEAALDYDINHMKIGIKLLIALVVTALVFRADRAKQEPSRGTLGLIAGLTAVNIAIAVLWS